MSVCNPENSSAKIRASWVTQTLAEYLIKHLSVITIFILAIALLLQSCATMNTYQDRISERRITEAKLLWDIMEKDGFTEKTIVSLDFSFFSNDNNGAKGLVKSLSENYTAEISTAQKDGYWLIKGTTRPYGKEINKKQWLEWVEYMLSVGFSNNAVFSTWSVSEPKKKKTWTSETIDVE